MRHDPVSRSWRPRTAVYALLLPVVVMLGGCVRPASAPAASALLSAVPAGSARIWFYRDYEPSVSLNLAAVALNGAPAGYVQPDGSAFYRDVAPGHYHVTVESYGMDVNQDKDVDLPAGREAFVKILALSSWENDGERNAFHRDTFYVSLGMPQIARAELATRSLGGG